MPASITHTYPAHAEIDSDAVAFIDQINIHCGGCKCIHAIKLHGSHASDGHILTL